MENLRVYVLTGLFGTLLMISSGLTLYHIVKAKYEVKIEIWFEGLDIEIKRTFKNCTDGVLWEEFNALENYYSESVNETGSSGVCKEEILCKNAIGNDPLSGELEIYCNATNRLNARIDILENTINEGGRKGETGTNGKHGRPGLNGDKGSEGRTGHKGSPGARGMKGDEGEKGMIGAAGDTGIKGVQGPIGPEGDKGLDGPDGLPGLPGYQGVPGFPGLDGFLGIPGDEGKKGDRGRIGRKGDKGETSFT